MKNIRITIGVCCFLALVGLGVFAPRAQAQNLFVANFGANTISEITPTGSMSIFATGLNGPCSLAFNNNGDLFVGNVGIYPNNTISTITPDGVRTTFATGVSQPSSLAFDSMDDLFVGDYTGSIFEFSNDTGTLSTTRTLFATASQPTYAIAFQPAPVPEPSTGALLAMGGIGLLGFCSLKRRRKLA